MRGSAPRIRPPGWKDSNATCKAAGAERIFSEKSSSTAPRPTLAECLAFLREGDVLTVTKPDRLARSTAELLAIEADLSKRGIGLVVLSMGGERLDTRNPTSKLMLTILAGVATWEREIMLERQREGIAKAKADGQIQGAAAERRPGADQEAAGADGPCGRREDDGDRAVDGLQAVGLTDRAHRAACNVRGAAIGQAQHRQETRPRGGAQMRGTPDSRSMLVPRTVILTG